MAITTAQPRKLLTELPDAPMTKAFRGIERLLREHPVLAATVQTWQSQEGWLADEINQPDFQACPMIALSPHPLPEQVLAADKSRVNARIAILVAVEGACIDDHINLWAQVQDALRSDRDFNGQRVDKYLCGLVGANIPFLKVSDPPWTERLPDGRPQGSSKTKTVVLFGRGTVDFWFQRPA